MSVYYSTVQFGELSSLTDVADIENIRVIQPVIEDPENLLIATSKAIAIINSERSDTPVWIAGNREEKGKHISSTP